MLALYKNSAEKTLSDIRNSRALTWLVPAWLLYWAFLAVMFMLPWQSTVGNPMAVRTYFMWGSMIISLYQVVIYCLALAVTAEVAVQKGLTLMGIFTKTLSLVVAMYLVSSAGPLLASVLRLVFGIPLPVATGMWLVVIWHTLPEIMALEGGFLRGLKPWLRYTKGFYLWATIPSILLYVVAAIIYWQLAAHLNWRQIPGMIILPVIIYGGIMFRTNLYLAYKRKVAAESQPEQAQPESL